MHSEAEEVRRLPPSCSSSSGCSSLTPSRPASQVSVYNDLEKRGLASESKLLRDEHEELEKQLYSVDWTKVRPFLLPPAHPTRSGANAALPRTQVDSPEFAPKFEKAIRMFIQHSDREEDEILRDLAAKLSPEDNDRLAKDFLAVRPSLSSSCSRLEEPCLTPRSPPRRAEAQGRPDAPAPGRAPVGRRSAEDARHGDQAARQDPRDAHGPLVRRPQVRARAHGRHAHQDRPVAPLVSGRVGLGPAPRPASRRRASRCLSLSPSLYRALALQLDDDVR